MNDSWFYNENFNGIPDDFFDDAIKSMDLPLEETELDDGQEDWEAKFQELEPPPSNVLVGLSSGFHGESSNVPLKVKKSSLLPDEEPSQLKQWRSTGDASSRRNIHLYNDPSERKFSHQFWTSSPVSVLESYSSSCSAENVKFHANLFVPVKRSRSKRHRHNRRFPYTFTSYASKNSHPSIASESEPETYTDATMSNSAKKGHKKRDLMLLSCTVEIKKRSSQQALQSRKCTHCETTKTPQWREGPMGPKTLCNACGVRYRSGRLLPEYRPASSPTFVPSVHSNSHRKVLEMRKNSEQVTTFTSTDTAVTMAPGYCS